MIAGLSFQVASITVFTGLCYDFAWRVHKDRESSKQQESHKLPFSLFNFHAFLYGKFQTSFANRCSKN